jgi:rhodanese-related sulfurtransferase
MKKIVMLILSLLMFLVACSSTSVVSDEIEIETIALKVNQEVQKGDYQVVSTQQLKSWLDEKKPMLIVDTMPYEASYKKNHIPGSVQFEFPVEEINELDSETQAQFEKLLGEDKDLPLVFYCGFTKCGRSHNGAMWARKLGYTQIYRHPGGIKAWLEAKYPVESAQ